MIEKNNKQELIKLVQENPELPLVFCNQNDERANDYNSTVYFNFYCYIGEVWKPDITDEIYVDDREYIEEIYADYLVGDDRFKDLFNEDFDKAISKYVEEHVEHYKAIIIDCKL